MKLFSNFMTLRRITFSFAVTLFAAIHMSVFPALAATGRTKPSVLIKQLIAETGMGKRQVSVAEFYKSLQKYAPPHVVKRFEPFVKYDANALMPKVDMATVKGAAGEIVRITLSQNSHRMVMDLVNNESTFIKVNGENISLQDFNQFNPAIEKLEKADKANPLMSFIAKPSTFAAMNAKEKVNYLLKLRGIVQQLEKTQNLLWQTASVDAASIFWRFILGDEAVARKVAGRFGQPCVIAGNMSKFGKDNYCGSDDAENLTQWTQKSCGSPKSILCNEFIYGYSDAGKPHCVPLNSHASKSCDAASPIYTEKEKSLVVKNLLKALDIEVEDAKISVKEKREGEQDKYLAAADRINGFLVKLDMNLDSTVKQCEINEKKGYTVLVKGKGTRAKTIYSSQKEACDVLHKRATELRKATCSKVAEIDKGFACPPYKEDIVPALVCDKSTQEPNLNIMDCCSKSDKCCLQAANQEERAKCGKTPDKGGGDGDKDGKDGKGDGSDHRDDKGTVVPPPVVPDNGGGKGGGVDGGGTNGDTTDGGQQPGNKDDKGTVVPPPVVPDNGVDKGGGVDGSSKDGGAKDGGTTGGDQQPGNKDDKGTVVPPPVVPDNGGDNKGGGVDGSSKDGGAKDGGTTGGDQQPGKDGDKGAQGPGGNDGANNQDGKTNPADGNVASACTVTGAVRVNGNCICPAEMPDVINGACVKSDTPTKPVIDRGEKKDKKKKEEKECKLCAWMPWIMIGTGLFAFWLANREQKDAKTSSGTNTTTTPVTTTTPTSEGGTVTRPTPAAGGVR